MHEVVTIGAQRPEISHWVDEVVLCPRRQRKEMVHVDDTGEFFAVGFGEVEAADEAGGCAGYFAHSA